MEDVIYIDELIKKILKRWRSIVVLTLIFTFIMGIYGYRVAQGGGDNFVYKSSFVVTNADYKDSGDTMALVVSVLRSKSVLQEVLDEHNLDYNATDVSFPLEIGTSSNGTVTMTMTMGKDYIDKTGFDFYKSYYEIGIETLLEKFPKCEVTVIDEPYIQSKPIDNIQKQKNTFYSMVRYALYGIILGIIISVFFTAIRILWNGKEFRK